MAVNITAHINTRLSHSTIYLTYITAIDHVPFGARLLNDDS